MEGMTRQTGPSASRGSLRSSSITSARGGFTQLGDSSASESSLPSPPTMESLRGSDRGDAIDLDVEVTRPRHDTHEHPGGGIPREIAGVNRIHRREFIDGRAIDGALQNVIEGRARRLEAELHLFHDQLGLTLQRRVYDLAGGRIERGEAGDVECVAMAGHSRSGGLPLLQVGG